MLPAHKVPFVMRSGLLAVLLAVTTAVFAKPGPSTTNNDDSCDIGVTPAATLLVPYFEVDLAARPGEGRTTVFNVVNVSYLPQIARVTVWSDYAYPVMSFSVFLTGYDVQAIDLRDLLVRGTIPSMVGVPGPRSADNFSNPNHSKNLVSECGSRIPFLPKMLLEDIRAVLTTGRTEGKYITCPDGEGNQLPLGGNHGANVAVGYVTVDVVSTCSAKLPTDPNYFTSDLLYDNVLTGDYIFIDPKGERNGYATGSAMVHIRAIPEGGPAGANIGTRMPQTFYGRFKPAVSDRRQPLPSVYAARYIEGGPEGFTTRISVWREAAIGSGASCAQYMTSAESQFVEITRFDERENAAIQSGPVAFSIKPRTTLPPVARLATSNGVFPASTSSDNGGWFYMNLADRGRNAQAWVDVTLFSEGRYGVQMPAASLGNGCSTAPVAGAQIGPVK
jgi:hypothetical protein